MFHRSVPWDFLLLFLVLGVLVPWRATMHVKSFLRRPQVSREERIALYATTIVFQWVVASLAFWRCMARGLSYEALGLAIPNAKVVGSTTIALAAGLTAIQFVGLRRLARVPVEKQGFSRDLARKVLPQSASEIAPFVVLAATAAICEEFLYRGFVLASLAAIGSHSVLLAAVGSSLLFCLAHAYQGGSGVTTTFIIGGIFAGVRIWTGSLLPPVCAHFTTDFIVGLCAPRRLNAGSVPNVEESDCRNGG